MKHKYKKLLVLVCLLTGAISSYAQWANLPIIGPRNIYPGRYEYHIPHIHNPNPYIHYQWSFGGGTTGASIVYTGFTNI